MASSTVDICNRALQKLGAKRIGLITENSPNARACIALYDQLRDAELRNHPWTFAIKRAEIAKDATDPAWGRDASFQLPTDFLRLINTYPEMNDPFTDFEIEGRKILTNRAAPLRIRYIARITDENVMDVLFTEALASRLAIELGEEITQSNTKKQLLYGEYEENINRAKKANAIERPAVVSPNSNYDDTWVNVRN